MAVKFARDPIFAKSRQDAQIHILRHIIVQSHVTVLGWGWGWGWWMRLKGVGWYRDVDWGMGDVRHLPLIGASFL